MIKTFASLALLSLAMGVSAASTAWADCESDLVQLEDAYKTPNLTDAARAALDEAKTAAVADMKKDDDAACHEAVVKGMGTAGIAMK